MIPERIIFVSRGITAFTYRGVKESQLKETVGMSTLTLVLVLCVFIFLFFPKLNENAV